MLRRVYLLLAVIIWGWTFVATKIALAYVTPIELLGLRLLTAIPVLLVILKAKRIPIRLERRNRNNILIGASILTAHFLIQITGLKYTSATNTGWIISVTPLVMAVLAFLFLKERLRVNQVIGIVVATLGILFLVTRGDFSSLEWLKSIGDWLVLVSAHTWAIYTVATRDVARRMNPLLLTFSMLLPAMIVILGYMAVTSDWSRFAHLPFEAVLAILFLGVLGMAVGHWFWQEGVAEVGAARAGIFLYLEPLATTALAVPYLHEAFGIFAALGAAMVMGGVVIAERIHPKRRAGISQQTIE